LTALPERLEVLPDDRSDAALKLDDLAKHLQV
jgi:hypothetical protein